MRLASGTTPCSPCRFLTQESVYGRVDTPDPLPVTMIQNLVYQRCPPNLSLTGTPGGRSGGIWVREDVLSREAPHGITCQ